MVRGQQERQVVGSDEGKGERREDREEKRDNKNENDGNRHQEGESAW